MEGKLIKTDNTYILSVNEHKDEVFAIADNNKAHELNKHKLSLKNCEAIENGYDLDELAYGSDLYEKMNFVGQMNAFKLGFQKAIEILGDKKFTEEDIRTAYSTGYEDGKSNDNFWTYLVKSLQQTEWDVEICCYIGNGDEESDSFKDSFVTNTGIPKLDENKCLILKRK